MLPHRDIGLAFSVQLGRRPLLAPVVFLVLLRQTSPAKTDALYLQEVIPNLCFGTKEIPDQP